MFRYDFQFVGPIGVEFSERFPFALSLRVLSIFPVDSHFMWNLKLSIVDLVSPIGYILGYILGIYHHQLCQCRYPKMIMRGIILRCVPQCRKSTWSVFDWCACRIGLMKNNDRDFDIRGCALKKGDFSFWREIPFLVNVYVFYILGTYVFVRQ